MIIFGSGSPEAAREAGHLLIFELTYPGSWIDLPNKDRAFQFASLLTLAEFHFTDAAVALNLFNDQQARGWTYQDREEWDRRAARRRELTEQVERILGTESLPAAFGWEVARYEGVSARIDLEVRRERWAAGVPPTEYANRPLFLLARAFVYALDSLGKVLGVLSREPDAPPGVAAAVEGYYAGLPALVGVRDSAHHTEDRARGLGKGGKPLDLQPVDNPAVRAPRGALVLDSLNGNKYCCTMNDGNLGEVEVSVKSMEIAQTRFLEVINAFKWTGPIRHTPS